MIRTGRVVVVEGRYDRLALERVCVDKIVETCGFGIFQDTQKQALLRRLAETCGLAVLTDSDGAGRAIRGFLNGLVPPDRVINLYIPDVPGRERRKKAPSKEGKLGVEGMSEEVLRQVFARAQPGSPPADGEKITSVDLYNVGLSGKPDSARRRREFQQSLDLPGGMSAAQLLAVLNCLMRRREFLERTGLPAPDECRKSPENADLSAPDQCRECPENAGMESER